MLCEKIRDRVARNPVFGQTECFWSRYWGPCRHRGVRAAMVHPDTVMCVNAPPCIGGTLSTTFKRLSQKC